MSSFRDLVIEQKREWQTLLERSYVKRDVVLPSGIENLARVVVGPRRAGKSVFAAHLAANEKGVSGYVNFDDERLARLTDTSALLAALDAVYGEPSVLLFDEIQNVPDWELWVNRLHRQGRRLILTGSNAHLLSSELATHLTGRHFSIPMLTFSFRLLPIRHQLSAVRHLENCRMQYFGSDFNWHWRDKAYKQLIGKLKIYFNRIKRRFQTRHFQKFNFDL
jgi:predicted AAA+ superfamily ATPase